jgi:hypothetical protein
LINLRLLLPQVFMIKNMNKRKLQSFYVFIGILTLILVNYPVIYRILNSNTGAFPSILVYLLVVALLVSIIGFILQKKNR